MTRSGQKHPYMALSRSAFPAISHPRLQSSRYHTTASLLEVLMPAGLFAQHLSEHSYACNILVFVG